MSEQRDNTTEHEEPSPKERDPQTGSYYYDDATGYEVYDPEQDDEDEGEDETEDDKHRATGDE